MTPGQWRTREKKWTRLWESRKLFQANPQPRRHKCFVTFPFPYMGGPLHVGHTFSVSRVDAYARYMRMVGRNVLFPWAWHWTGKTAVGAAERIALGDQSFIQALRDVDRVPDKDLKKFVDPVYMATYYTRDGKEGLRKLGVSVDWRREFHTSSLHPAYSRFVAWQYLTLKEKGYLRKGTHPVVWCPKDGSPTGDADRLQGEGVRPEEYVLVKFRMGDSILPCATLRPETIFGVTNLWINPDVEYITCDIDGEHWIVSRTCVQKLSEQLKKVTVNNSIQGSALIGRRCSAPSGREYPILPAMFVNPENGTGLVYSVPAHAPFDWLALKDLRNSEEAQKRFNLSSDFVKAIEPISIIRAPGFGDYPAVEVSDRMGLKTQLDPGAQEATQTVYRKEFHEGVLKENCGPYAGLKVSEVKEKLVEDFRSNGWMDRFYELPDKVVCRCTTECHVRILENQWFLAYSDDSWKSRVKDLLSNMAVMPPEAKNWFAETVDWLRDWACVRKSGLGTPFPLDSEWLVETLSDSTIYMAFYTISRYFHERKARAENLTQELLDFVFLGKGDDRTVAHSCKLSVRTVRAMRDEFMYWYPVDLRNTGKDLISNHMTFYLFHHTAMFPRTQWPRAVSVNGMVRVEGRQMRRSFGNFIPLKRALEEYGADAARCALLLSAEGMDDPDWRADAVREIRSKIESFRDFAVRLSKSRSPGRKGRVEAWLISRLARRVRSVSSDLEAMRTRSAIQTALFDVWNDFRWYLRRTERPHARTIRDVLRVWVRLLAPFTPFVCEELWKKLGGRGFVSVAAWPGSEDRLLDLRAEAEEQLVRGLLEDMEHVLKIGQASSSTVHVYAAADWKWRVYRDGLSRKTVEPRLLIREYLDDARMKSFGPEVPQVVTKVQGLVSRLDANERENRLKLGVLDEAKAVADASRFLSRELRLKVRVWREGEKGVYDPKGRSSMALPYRPAFFFE